MPLEDLTGPDKFIDALVNTNPPPADPLDEGCFHLTGIKNVLGNSFPGITGAVTATQAQIDGVALPGSSPTFLQVSAQNTNRTDAGYAGAQLRAIVGPDSLVDLASVSFRSADQGATGQVGINAVNSLGFFDSAGGLLAGYMFETGRFRGPPSGFEVTADNTGVRLSRNSQYHDQDATTSVVNFGASVTRWNILFNSVAFASFDTALGRMGAGVVAATNPLLSRHNTGFRTIPGDVVTVCDAGCAPAIQRGVSTTNVSGFFDLTLDFAFATVPQIVLTGRDNATPTIFFVTFATTTTFRINAAVWNGSTFVAGQGTCSWIAIPNEIAAF
jgi:hypothetical protein